MGPSRALVALLLALTGAWAAPTDAPDGAAAACPRGCRCFIADGKAAANCSSPAAALALGERLHVLRLSHYDDHLSVKEGAFHALPELRELRLDHLALVKVYPGAFRGLVHLDTLDLSHNALSAGDELSRALRDLPALRRLSLRGNNFGSSSGAPPALASRSLKFVDLGRCKLRDLPSSVLAGLTHVRHVVLDGNFIRNFRADAFPRSVVSIDLSHNDIDRVSMAELKKLENVDTVELAENPLHCTCELLKISYDYNMNKPVVCAYPKQLMGKDLLKIKKQQVCGGHKKVKREAGNELDDKALSKEDVENDDIIDEAPEEAGLEETAADISVTEQPTHEEKQEKAQTAADEEGSPEATADDGDETQGEADTDTDARASAVDDQNKNENEEGLADDDGPENIDGPLPAQHSPQDIENMAAEDVGDVDDDTEREGGHIVNDPNPGPPPEEEVEDEDDEPVEEQAAELPVERKESPVYDRTENENENGPESARGELDAVGQAVRQDDQDNAENEDVEDTENGDVNAEASAVDEGHNEEDAEDAAQVVENAESQEGPVEQDPPDSLTPSEYAHVQAANGNRDSEERENEGTGNEEAAGEEAEDKPDQEEQDAGERASQVAAGEVEVNENTNTETGADGDAAGGGAEVQAEDKGETPDQVPDTEEEDTDVNNNSGAEGVVEGAQLETANNLENSNEDADNGLDNGNAEDKENKNDEDTFNEDDILPGSEVHRKEAEQESAREQANEEDSGDVRNNDGNAETHDEVERVGDSPNVVHISDVGARTEDEPDIPTQDEDDVEIKEEAVENAADRNADGDEGEKHVHVGNTGNVEEEDNEVVGNPAPENANHIEGNENEDNEEVPALVLSEDGENGDDGVEPEGKEEDVDADEDNETIVGGAFGEGDYGNNKNNEEVPPVDLTEGGANEENEAEPENNENVDADEDNDETVVDGATDEGDSGNNKNNEEVPPVGLTEGDGNDEDEAQLEEKKNEDVEADIDDDEVVVGGVTDGDNDNMNNEEVPPVGLTGQGENEAEPEEKNENVDADENNDETVVGETVDEGRRDNTMDENAERIEEELKEDREHATLGHEDIDNETDGDSAAAKDPTDKQTQDDNDFASEEESPILPPSDDNQQGEDENESEAAAEGVMGNENDEEINENHPVVHSPKAAADENVLSPQEYEEIQGRTEDDEAPGGSMVITPTDTDDSEEEGSGNELETVNNVLDVASSKGDKTPEKTETTSEREDAAVPPLDNVDAEDGDDADEEAVVPPLVNGDSEERDEANEEDEDAKTTHAAPNPFPSLDVLGAADNGTDDEEDAGSGAALAPGVVIENGEGDYEATPDEAEEGSGQPIIVVQPPTTKKPSTVWDDSDNNEDDKEGSGIDPNILFIPERTGNEDETGDGEDDGQTDETDTATTAAPVVVEEEVIARHNIPVFAAPPQSAPPRQHEETPTGGDDGGEKQPEQGESEEIEDPEEKTDRADAGRALGAPVAAEEDDETREGAGDNKDHAIAPPPENLNPVEVVADVGGETKGNVVVAGPDDSADGSEALNKADAASMNTIASYVVLGAIMLIVVVLLGYAVCRSRRQKSGSPRDKDVENPGREMHDVNKPLINNHNPSAPEKQLLDETEQPLMTKEQEASLTIEPPEKQSLSDATDAVDHKPHQNGGVPEAVQERAVAAPLAALPFSPATNGKAASPIAERAPSPAALAPAPSPAASSPAPSPTADGHANGSAVPLANGGAASPGAGPATSPAAAAAAAAAPPVSPGAVRVVAKELPDAKRPVIIMNRSGDQQQQQQM